MRNRARLLTIIFIAALACAQEPKAYQEAELVRMESVPCGSRVCQEYILQTDRTVYRVRPKNEKNSELLPVGERAQFRLSKNKFLLRLQGATEEGREREYIVTSVTARGESSADATPIHLNHLQ